MSDGDVVDDWFSGLPRAALLRKLFAMWIIVPAGCLLGAVIVSNEYETGLTVFLCTMGAAFFSGVMTANIGLGVVNGALAAAWLPSFAAWSRLYWKAGMAAPGGPAQSVLRVFFRRDVDGWIAVALLAAAAAASGWALAKKAEREAELMKERRREKQRQESRGKRK